MEFSELIQGLDMNSETRDKIEIIIKIYEKRNASIQEKEAAARLVDEVLAALFQTQYSYVVPVSFINTEIGTILFEVKFSHQYYYSASDAVIILGKTRTNIYHNRNKGLLKMIKRGGAYFVTEGELRRYMEYKKIPGKEINRRLNAFWKVRKDHYEERISRKEFEELYKKLTMKK